MSSILSSLKLVNAKRKNSVDPVVFRRNKLNEKLKIQIATALSLNKTEIPTVKRMRSIRNEITDLTLSPYLVKLLKA